MTLPRYQELRRKASLAMRTGEYEVALDLYHQLEKLLPDDASWPERRAGACRELGQSEQELACLLRALEIQVDTGQVLAAIASCNRILEIEPGHPSTLECLHLLYTQPAMNPGTHVAQLTPEPPESSEAEDSGVAPASVEGAAPDERAPLVELELRDVIPGAREGALAGDPEQSVAEIPLERDLHCDESSPALDLKLDRRAVPCPERRAAQAPLERRSAPDVLAATPLFGALPPAVLHDLMTRVRVVRLAAGEVLFREGEPANALYVVVDGAVVPIAEGPPRKRLAVLERGAFFGEIGLVTDQPRNATIEALVETRLLAIDRALVWSLVRGRPEMSRVLLRFLRERLVDKQLRTHPFFAAFGRAERSAVARQFRFLEVRDGAALVEQGRPVDGLFVVLAGELEVIDAGRGKSIGTLGSGELFGAQALLGSRPAAMRVVARGKCWVLVMGEGRFRRILRDNPRLERLLGRLARRARGERDLV